MPEKTETGSSPRRQSLVIATAGHVDHGKTSLVKRITGTDTDTLQEERTRGLTINPGFAYLHFDCTVADKDCQCTLGFVDVPGHVDFINNMLSGVGAVASALLIVAADDGVMPQTREHLAILNLLDIPLGAIALTKIDRCNQSRVDEVSADILELLPQPSRGEVSILPVSNLTGQGVSELTERLKQLAAQAIQQQVAADQFNLRYLIDRSFTVKGAGTVVTGTVKSGAISEGESVLHTGSASMARVRGLRLDDRGIDSVTAQQRAAINLNLDLGLINRGDWLVDADFHHPVHRFDASLTLIDPRFELRSSAEYHLFVGASHHIVTIRNLDPTQQRFFQIKSHETMIVHHGDKFILRDPASQHTIGGGKVIDSFVPRRRRSSQQRLESLAAMDNDAPTALRSLLSISPDGVDLETFAINRNLRSDYLEQLLSALLTESPDCCKSLKLEKRSKAVLLHEKFYRQYSEQILGCLAELHRTRPHEQGLGEPMLGKAIDFNASHQLFHGLLAALEEEGRIKRSGTLLHLPGHSTALSKEQEQFLAKVKPLLLEAGNVPPRTRELVELTGIALKPLERILRESTRAGSLVQVAHNRHYLPETIMSLADFTENLAVSADDEGFSVIQFRDASGIGRNLCIEILEYFDRIGFTRRDGNARFVRTEKENIFRD